TDDDPGTESHRVTMPDHCRKDDGADGNDGGNAGTTDQGEHGAGDNARQCQATMEVADHADGKVDHPSGHAAMGEEVTGQNKERYGHDLEFLNAGEELESHRLNRDIG